MEGRTDPILYDPSGYHQRSNKKLKHCWYMSKKVSIKYYLCITISNDHLQSKIIYLYQNKVRNLKTVKKFFDVAK